MAGEEGREPVPARLGFGAALRHLAPTGLFRPGYQPRGQHQLITALAAVFFLLALAGDLLIIAGSVANLTGLWLALLAALVPAIAYSLLVLSLDRYEREPWRATLGAFAWGAVVATIFSVVFSALTGGALTAVWGERAGRLIALGVGAPVIEESFKGLALLGLLLIFRDEFDGILDGLVYGALIGLGFAMTENILYLGHAYVTGGAAALGQLFLAREIFGGLGHALYTGTVGAAVGWTRVQHGRGGLRFVVPVAGWTLAVAQHSLWNTGAVVAATRAAPGSLGLVVAIKTAVFVLPGVIILLAIAAKARRAESRIIREHLADEVAAGALTAREYAALASEGARRAAALTALRRGGPRRWATQQAFFQAAAELALCKYHCGQGDGPDAPAFCRPEDEYRARLVALRAALAGD